MHRVRAEKLRLRAWRAEAESLSLGVAGRPHVLQSVWMSVRTLNISMGVLLRLGSSCLELACASDEERPREAMRSIISGNMCEVPAGSAQGGLSVGRFPMGVQTWNF